MKQATKPYLSFNFIERRLARLVNKLIIWPINELLSNLQRKIMATLQEVQAEIDALKTRVSSEATEVKAAVDALQTQVQALKDQIAAGTAVTPADLDALVTSLQEVGASVDAIIDPNA